MLKFDEGPESFRMWDLNLHTMSQNRTLEPLPQGALEARLVELSAGVLLHGTLYTVSVSSLLSS